MPSQTLRTTPDAPDFDEAVGLTYDQAPDYDEAPIDPDYEQAPDPNYDEGSQEYRPRKQK